MFAGCECQSVYVLVCVLLFFLCVSRHIWIGGLNVNKGRRRWGGDFFGCFFSISVLYFMVWFLQYAQVILSTKATESEVRTHKTLLAILHERKKYNLRRNHIPFKNSLTSNTFQKKFKHLNMVNIYRVVIGILLSKIWKRLLCNMVKIYWNIPSRGVELNKTLLWRPACEHVYRRCECAYVFNVVKKAG